MRKRPLLRRLSSLGRVFVALALLGALWAGTYTAIGDANERAAARRVQDRVFLAEALADPLAR
ncbi:MAG: hypothetical protein QOJ09_2605, partial [Actinomycetota bacterium]|nr:hypothetical protein [Actinomycetota bacterium]